MDKFRKEVVDHLQSCERLLILAQQTNGLTSEECDAILSHSVGLGDEIIWHQSTILYK
jgi:hypothetical protein